MRSWKKMSVPLKVAVAATVILALSIVAVVADERLGGSKDDAAKARETAAAPEPADDEMKLAGKRLKLGTVAKISPSYRAAVSELTLYNISTGRIMVVTVEATYIGKSDGEPWGDLTVKYVAPDSKTYGESQCPFDLGELDASDQATLKRGDKTTYGVCIDLPAGAIDDGRVVVEEALARQERTRSWTTEGAVTKTPPAIASRPAGSAGDQDDDSSSQRSSGGNSAPDYSEECEKYEDDVEEYRDGRDDLDELAEQYENDPDYDEDKAEDYEEWLDAMDKNVERYEQLCE